METRYLWVVAAMGMSLALSAPVLAASPVALATSVTGTTVPAVELFTEFDVRAKITLGSGAEIEFLYYASCQTVVVRGGTLSFTADRFLLRRGKILRTKRVNCPNTVVLTGTSQFGGIVLRGRSRTKTLRVTTAPSFIFVGSGALNVASIKVTLDGRNIIGAMNPGRVFQWPANAPQLENGHAYLVTLKLRGTPEPKSFKVKVENGGGKGIMTLIRLN